MMINKRLIGTVNALFRRIGTNYRLVLGFDIPFMIYHITNMLTL